MYVNTAIGINASRKFFDNVKGIRRVSSNCFILNLLHINDEFTKIIKDNQVALKESGILIRSNLTKITRIKIALIFGGERECIAGSEGWPGGSSSSPGLLPHSVNAPEDTELCFPLIFHFLSEFDVGAFFQDEI